MKLAELPTKTALGKCLVADTDERSGTAFRNQANKFLDPFYLEGSFVLQNLRITHPNIEELLTPLEHSLMMG